MKAESASRIIKNFVGLCPRLNEYVVVNEQCIRKAKGVKPNVLQSLRYKDYRNCLKNGTRVLGTQYQFHLYAHKVYTEHVTKVVLSVMDGKRYIEEDGSNVISRADNIAPQYTTLSQHTTPQYNTRAPRVRTCLSRSSPQKRKKANKHNIPSTRLHPQSTAETKQNLLRQQHTWWGEKYGRSYDLLSSWPDLILFLSVCDGHLVLKVNAVGTRNGSWDHRFTFSRRRRLFAGPQNPQQWPVVATESPWDPSAPGARSVDPLDCYVNHVSPEPVLHHRTVWSERSNPNDLAIRRYDSCGFQSDCETSLEVRQRRKATSLASSLHYSSLCMLANHRPVFLALMRLQLHASGYVLCSVPAAPLPGVRSNANVSTRDHEHARPYSRYLHRFVDAGCVVDQRVCMGIVSIDLWRMPQSFNVQRSFERTVASKQEEYGTNVPHPKPVLAECEEEIRKQSVIRHQRYCKREHFLRTKPNEMAQWSRIRENPVSIPRPAILISVFDGFPKSLQTKAGMGSTVQRRNTKKGGGGQEIPEKVRQTVASSGTISMRENPRATTPGFEPVSPLSRCATAAPSPALIQHVHEFPPNSGIFITLLVYFETANRSAAEKRSRSKRLMKTVHFERETTAIATLSKRGEREGVSVYSRKVRNTESSAVGEARYSDIHRQLPKELRTLRKQPRFAEPTRTAWSPLCETNKFVSFHAAIIHLLPRRSRRLTTINAPIPLHWFDSVMLHLFASRTALLSARCSTINAPLDHPPMSGRGSILNSYCLFRTEPNLCHRSLNRLINRSQGVFQHSESNIDGSVNREHLWWGPTSPQCRRVPKASYCTVAFTRRVPHPLVHSHHKHLVRRRLTISRQSSVLFTDVSLHSISPTALS
ncbi:hypothetical protein PR048_009953 [Dryococelus australis]|uniref:Uncharacterized protein n=1 Tax=Dryococelus australis TaxID=614101 RepID=A0ABQ9I1C4_9NEOP|nr:hypothetical protein PR048_009953 [Dryococelus australis]